jgi:phasin family protein
VTNTRHAERDTDQTTRRATAEGEQTVRTMSNAAERSARAGAEASRRNAESIGGVWRQSGETATHIAERSFDQFSKVFGIGGDRARRTMETSTANVQALIDSSMVFAKAFNELSGEWMRFLQTRVDDNLDHMDRFMSCRSPQECLAFQTQIARDNIEALLETARRTSEVSTRLTGDAVRHMGKAAGPLSVWMRRATRGINRTE